MAVEWRVAYVDEVTDMTFGAMATAREVMTAPDCSHAIMWAQGFELVGEPTMVQARVVSDWVTPEGPLDGPRHRDEPADLADIILKPVGKVLLVWSDGTRMIADQYGATIDPKSRPGTGS